MAKKIDPLDFYQNQFNASWYELHKLIDEDTQDIETEDAPKLKIVIEYMESLGQLLDEIVFHQKQQIKKTKKSKK